MEKEVTSKETEKSFFSDLSWKGAAIIAVIGFITGGTGGGIATRATKAEGLTQEAADVRYLTKEEAEKKAAKRDSSIDDLKRSIVTKDVFDERTKAIQDEQLRQRQMLERILERK